VTPLVGAVDSALFGNVVGQPLALTVLGQALQRGSAHAYLLHGPRGVGKTDAAYAFAAGLLCPDGGCCHCDHCRRARSGVHVDLETVAPDGSSILIDQIRQLTLDAAMRPYEAARRVYVILEAETMTEPAANAFLKTLEEPPSHARFVLVSSAPERLLPTVVSRCQRVPFFRTPAKALAAHLGSRYGLRAEDAWALARVAQGDLSYAEALTHSQSVREDRVLVLSLARELPSAGFARVQGMADEVMAMLGRRVAAAVACVEDQKTCEMEWAADARARSRVEKAFDVRLRREKRAAVQAGIDHVISGSAGWFRDLAVVAVGAEETVHNFDYLAELREDVLPGLLSSYLEVIAAAKRTKERFRYNVDTRCSLEHMLFSMKEALL